MTEFNLVDVPADIAVPVLHKRRTMLYQESVDKYAVSEALSVQVGMTEDEEKQRIARVIELNNTAANALAGAMRLSEIISGIQQARISSGMQMVALVESGNNGD